MGGVFSERQIEQLSELTSRGWGIYDRTVKITEEMQVDVLSLRAEGMPSSEIAKKVGCRFVRFSASRGPPPTTRQAMRRLGRCSGNTRIGRRSNPIRKLIF